MTDGGDDSIQNFNIENHAFSYKTIQKMFESCLFTAMDKELRDEALRGYARVANKQYHTESIVKALHALEDRSLTWLSFPQESAMKDQKETIREFIHDTKDILAPISYAADSLKEDIFSNQDERSIAAIYFSYLKQRLEQGLQSAQSFLDNGELVIVEKAISGVDAAEKDGVFAQKVVTPAAVHMFALHGTMCFDEEFLEQTKNAATQAGMAPERVDNLIQNFAKVILVTRAYAKTGGDSKQDELKRQKLLKIITKMAPSLCADIAEMQSKFSQLDPQAQSQVELLHLVIGENLAALKNYLSKD